ncbi:hypothetical protein LZ554_005276 [Drepanopeziza brunnea f. sp. 'monogermtubi']|nr:hypothetical protein LZ554_005276 [Drepanopeziza brunnea f. sp. 'monogermtubi']
MAREGTRQATGNARPRIFPTVPEVTIAAPKKKTTMNIGAKRGPKAATTKTSKPVGITKKVAPAKKTAVANKLKGVVKKTEAAITKTPAKKAAATKKIKDTDGPKTSTKSKTPVKARTVKK